jgi:hypothetical protein
LRHPDPNSPPGLRPIVVGEVWENPLTGERGKILELPWTNPAGRATAELTAIVGAQVVGEHYHPALVERFTAIAGELTIKRDGQSSVLRERETAAIEADVWHAPSWRRARSRALGTLTRQRGVRNLGRAFFGSAGAFGKPVGF